MPEHDVHSQGTLDSNAAGTSESLHSNELSKSVDSRVAACEKLVDEAVEQDLPPVVLADSLKTLGRTRRP